jgi:ABC-type spermidine/putrescine transport system permease subunit I
MMVPNGFIATLTFWLKACPTFKPAFQFGSCLTHFADPQDVQVVLRMPKVSAPELAVSLVLAFSIACSLVVRCRWPRLRTWLSMAVIASLQVSYGLCSYSWATILGTEAS